MAALLIHRVEDAVSALRDGGLVALPTETVYGLGADADSPTAVERIYAVKGRPPGHPVIVHCASAEHAWGWASSTPDWAVGLADECWPGPLTLVLPRAPRAGDHLTGGQDTVGVRVSAHPVMHEVLTQFAGAIAAPSANLFGRVSPTTAEHVASGLGDRLNPESDRILDGGPCTVGVESTIVDATGGGPRLLRPGGITASDIERITGLSVTETDGRIRAPGSLASHYSPQATVILAEPDQLDAILRSIRPHDSHSPPVIGLIAMTDVSVPHEASVVRLCAPQNTAEYARVLYAALRHADDNQMDTVVAVPPSNHGIGAAINDRLRRAAHGQGDTRSP